MENKISKASAEHFWRDLMGTLWHDPETKSTHGTMSPKLVGEHMGIPTETAEEYLWACVKYGLSDRANGAFVV